MASPRDAGEHAQRADVVGGDRQAIEDVVGEQRADGAVARDEGRDDELLAQGDPGERPLRHASGVGAAEDERVLGPDRADHGMVRVREGDPGLPDETVQRRVGAAALEHVALDETLDGEALAVELLPDVIGLLVAGGADAHGATDVPVFLLEQEEEGAIEGEAGAGRRAGEDHVEEPVELEGALHQIRDGVDQRETLELVREVGRVLVGDEVPHGGVGALHVDHALPDVEVVTVLLPEDQIPRGAVVPGAARRPRGRNLGALEDLEHATAQDLARRVAEHALRRRAPVGAEPPLVDEQDPDRHQSQDGLDRVGRQDGGGLGSGVGPGLRVVGGRHPRVPGSGFPHVTGRPWSGRGASPGARRARDPGPRTSGSGRPGR
jgi:hypothetical protein